MTAVAEYQFPATGQGVRTVLISGVPWFVAADVVMVLGYGGGARNAISRLPDRMKGVAGINTPGGEQQMTVLSEPGVYRLVMRSNLPDAEAFQDWIAEDVVPAIRQTGTYAVADAYQIPQSLPEALRAYAAEVEAHDVTKAALTEALPAADAWNVLADAQGDYSLREAAQILNRDPLIKTGQNRLARYLQSIGWTDSTKQPYQTHVDNGRLVRRPTSYEHPNTGERSASWQVRITAKGLKDLRPRMAGQQGLLTIAEGA